MAISVVTGTIKNVDSKGNEQSQVISLVDLFNTMNLMLNELKKITLHLSIINDTLLEDKDI